MNMRKVNLWVAVIVLMAAASSAAQVAVSPFKSPHVTFTDADGAPLAGGCVFTYLAGTSTPLGSYTDSTGSTLNSNPVILDASGSANIWLGPSNYKFAIWSNGGTNCASGALQWTVDNVPGNLFNNTTISGGTWSGGTITGAAVSGGTISGAAITGSTIDSTPIGQTTPASGSFTSLASAFDAVPFSATPVFPAGSYGYFSMTLTNNVTSSSITGGTDGQLITFNICQNGTGQTVGGITTGFTFAWPANYTNPPVVNPILSACTIATAYYNGGFWYTVSTSQQLLAGNFDAIPYSATPVFPAESYSNFALTLTGAVTSSTITGGAIGQVATVDICEDSTGGYAFTWPVNVLNAPTVSTSANSCTGVTLVYNGTNWTTVANSSATTQTPLTGNMEVIPFTATPIFNVANDSAFEMVLTGNVTSSSISGGTAGQLISIVMKQGSSTTPAPGSAPTYSTLTTGGSLPATTTYYAKCAYVYGAVESLPSAEASETTGAGATNSITWNCPAGSNVTNYKFYIGTGTGAETYYFTSSSASYIQIGVPSTGTPGVPYTGSTYTVAWPSNLINPPLMSNGVGATTALVALFDGTNWVTVGTSGSGSTGVVCSGQSCYRQNADGSFDEWGVTPTFGGADAGTFSMSWPHTFTNLNSITAVFSAADCVGGDATACSTGSGGTDGGFYSCAVMTPSLSAPTVMWTASNTVHSGAFCYFRVSGY